jgi:hypothetical protein
LRIKQGVVEHACNPNTWRQEDHEASLGYIVRAYLKINKVESHNLRILVCSSIEASDLVYFAYLEIEKRG